MSEEENNSKADLMKFGIIGLVVLFFIFKWFGTGLIRTYKQQKEWELITLGGSKSDAEKTIKEYNDQVTIFNQIIDSALTQNPRILVYSNDSTIQRGILSPNINYEVFSESGFGTTFIQNKRAAIDELRFFADHKDSIGFNIWLKGKGRDVQVMDINNQSKHQEYKVHTYFFYSEKIKQHLKNRIEKMPKHLFDYPYVSKERQLEALEKEQSSKVILTEIELENQKIQDNLIALYAPANGSITPSHKFYFTAYNKQISKEQFKNSVKKFVTMFLKDQNTSGCFVKEITLSKEE